MFSWVLRLFIFLSGICGFCIFVICTNILTSCKYVYIYNTHSKQLVVNFSYSLQHNKNDTNEAKLITSAYDVGIYSKQLNYLRDFWLFVITCRYIFEYLFAVLRLVYLDNICCKWLTPFTNKLTEARFASSVALCC